MTFITFQGASIVLLWLLLSNPGGYRSREDVPDSDGKARLLYLLHEYVLYILYIQLGVGYSTDRLYFVRTHCIYVIHYPSNIFSIRSTVRYIPGMVPTYILNVPLLLLDYVCIYCANFGTYLTGTNSYYRMTRLKLRLQEF